MSRKPTPEATTNRPGLTAIRSRVGRHPAFLASLRRGLADANRPGLADLGQRAGADFTLALLDSWAAVLDNLAFHTERQANEAYLRTATQRRSLRAHAALIGYELAPAKSASCHLAFTVEPVNGSPTTLEYPPGLQVRSVPRDGELPQMFETMEPLIARADWNALRPLPAMPPQLHADSRELRLPAGSARVEVGDALLLLEDGAPLASGGSWLRRITSLATDADGELRLQLDVQPAPAATRRARPARTAAAGPLSGTRLAALIDRESWSLASARQLGTANRLSASELQQALRAASRAPTPQPISAQLLRVRTGFFGATAIDAPADLPITSLDRDAPDGWAHLYLDRDQKGIAAGQPVLIRGGGRELWLDVGAVETVGISAFGLAARVTRLQVRDRGLGVDGRELSPARFAIRGSTLFAGLQPLALAAQTIDTPVGAAADGLSAAQVEIDSAQLLLLPGKTLIITGERADLPGVEAAEIRTLADNEITGGHSLLTFERPLDHVYVRASVRICANVAAATHGETRAETLGDGDARQSFQRFRLQAAPLSHVSARNPRGMEPAIEVRVNDVRWQLVADFRAAGPDARVFALRADDAGDFHVLFGDGVTGARLPTGHGNVTATYRSGAGLAGAVEAGQLTLPVARPAGVKAVTNPQPAMGARDRAQLADARRNAPLGVLTLGRVVALRDYADFARSFAGIAKAHAREMNGRVLLTVAAADGALLPENGADLANLRAALAAAGDADVGVDIRNYRPTPFGVHARLRIDPAYQPAEVLAAAEARLLTAFAFAAREFGAAVTAAQVIAALQAVAGVAAVHLDALYTGTTPSLQPRLRLVADGPAQLLVIDPAQLQLEALA